MKKFEEFNKLKFSDILTKPKREVYITLLYNDKNFEKFGIVKSTDIIGMVYDHDDPNSFTGIKCHVFGYDYAYIDFEDSEDLNTTMKIDNSGGYTIFSNYSDALSFYEDNI